MTPAPKTVEDLGKQVKAKYPGQYDDMSDADVGVKVKSKFPGSYDDFVPLAPKGTAKPDPFGPQDPGQVTPKSLLGSGVNIANNAYAGGALGSMFGPVGTAAGAGAGALAGIFQQPSTTPGMDAGALAGSIGVGLLPGGRIAQATGMPQRLIRGLGQVAGVTGGALAGSQLDKTLGFTKDTDYGKVGVYAAGASLAGIVGSFASDASPTMQASQRLQNATGVNYPLSAPESTGRFGSLAKFFMNGSGGAQDLAAAQSQAAQSAFAKIVGAPVEDSVNIIANAAKYRRDLRGTVAQFARDYRNANAQTVTSQVPSSVIDPSTGKPVMNTVSKTIFPKKIDWTDFQTKYGLTDDERDMFFRSIKTNAEQFVNQLAPTTSENPVKGFFKLAGLMKVLEGSGNKTGAVQLGQAFAMRDLAPALQDTTMDGANLADRIDNAMEHFKIVFDPKQVEALKDLSTVARNATPLNKALGQSGAEHSGSYLMNKVLFGTASMAGAMGAGAHGLGADTAAVWLLGTGAGATVALGTSALVGKLLANPYLGKTLIAASKGDQRAMSAAVRAFATDRYSASEAPDSQSPANRLTGWFQKK